MVKRFTLLLCLGMTVLLADFLSKAYMYDLCPLLGCSETLFNLFGIEFSLALTTNKGTAWGLFPQFQGVLLIIRMALVTGMLFYLFFINKRPHYQVPLVLILAGACGNIVDFFLYGFVIDFLRFNLWGYHFPVFNIADSAITVGVCWLFLATSFKKRTCKDQKSPNS